MQIFTYPYIRQNGVSTGTVSIVMINSRGKSHPEWVEKAQQSALSQVASVTKVQLVEVMNLDREFTIGHCWNAGVKAADGDLVTFLGDDDMIAPEFTDFLFSFYAHQEPTAPFISSFCKPCDESMRPISGAYMEAAFTGMYLKDFLLRNPFDEKLKKGVDTAYVEHLKRKGIRGSLCPHYFGYYYRMHPGQVSGMKKPKKVGKGR